MLNGAPLQVKGGKMTLVKYRTILFYYMDYLRFLIMYKTTSIELFLNNFKTNDSF